MTSEQAAEYLKNLPDPENQAEIDQLSAEFLRSSTPQERDDIARRVARALGVSDVG